jgi:hypothetical protein
LTGPLFGRGSKRFLLYESAGTDLVLGRPLLFRVEPDAEDAEDVERRVQDLRAEDRLASLAKYVLGRVEGGHATVEWEGRSAPFAAARDEYAPSGTEDALLKEAPEE